MVKKIISLTLSLIMVIGVCPLIGMSAAADGYCGEMVNWTLNWDTGELIIDGKGPMTSYDYAGGNIPPWDQVSDKIKTIVVKGEVSSVGSNAFYHCLNLVEANLLSPTIVSEGAFRGCLKLSRVNLGSNMTTIGAEAFADTDLFAINVPESVNKIEAGAFSECERLTQVCVSSYDTVIDKTAFQNCPSFLNVFCYSGSKAYDMVNENDIRYTPLESMSGLSIKGLKKTYYTGDSFPYDEVEVVCNFINSDNEILDIYTIQAYSVFDFDTSLKTDDSPRLKVPVVKFGPLSYDVMCNISEPYIEFKDDISEFELNPRFEAESTVRPQFTVFPSTATAEIADSNDSFILVSDERDEVLAVGYGESEQEIEICYKGNKFYAPFRINSVDKLGENVYWTLNEATGLLTISGSGKMYTDRFSYTSEKEYILPAWIEKSEKIKEIVIEDGITSIGSYVFCGLDKVEKITIPESVTSIEKGAFDNCSLLKNIKALGVTNVGEKAFSRCISLSNVEFGENPVEAQKDAFAAIQENVYPKQTVKMKFNCKSQEFDSDGFTEYNEGAKISLVIDSTTRSATAAMVLCDDNKLFTFEFYNAPNSIELANTPTTTKFPSSEDIKFTGVKDEPGAFIEVLGTYFIENGLTITLPIHDFSITKTLVEGSENEYCVSVVEPVGNKSCEFFVDVVNPSIDITNTIKGEMMLGSRQKLTCEGYNDFDKNLDIVWEVDDTGVLEIAPPENINGSATPGYVIAVNRGTAKLTASFEYKGVVYSSSQTVVVGDKCGDNITWELADNGDTLYLRGSGEMWDCLVLNNHVVAPWTTNVKKVYIDKDITHIGYNAFYGFNSQTFFVYDNSCFEKYLKGTNATTGFIVYIEDIDENKLKVVDCNNLCACSKYELPETINSMQFVELGDEAFSDESMINTSSIILPISIEKIGEAAVGYVYKNGKYNLISNFVLSGYEKALQSEARDFAKENGINFIGLIDMNSIALGDVNTDGAINAKDVLVLRKFLASLPVNINQNFADVNSDEVINAKDILVLRKMLANV